MQKDANFAIDDLKIFWPGNFFYHNGLDWICKICGEIANHKKGHSGTLRKNARYYHTLTRCAQGLRGKHTQLQNEAAKIVEREAHACYNEFISYFSIGETNGKGGTNNHMAAGYGVETRSRSRSPPRQLQGSEIGTATDVNSDPYIGKRIAKMFDGLLFFGTVAEKIRGAVLAKQPDGNRLWQAVWKIVFDDSDSEEMNRLEIMAAIEFYRIHESKDLQKSQAAIQVVDENVIEGEVEYPDHGIPSSETDFLDPHYCLLDLLTPTATQNRLSYLVELVIDKTKKQISNEALKERLRKDSAAFGAKNMPTDVRAIGRFLGARDLKEVTRHRCGGDGCSYAWIGAIDECNYDIDDVCPECGHPRYVLDRGNLRPQRVFDYFGAVQAIKALHRHPIFKAEWKQNMDISLNAYRSSPDATRLNAATGNQALAAENGLYISMADGFQSHLSSTKSITG